MGLEQNRSKVIVRTSIIGIIANIFLAGFKAAVGLISGSIAVVLDAVNNLSDALSSVITIIGTKLADRTPDKKHPLGHGRIEYISALVVAAIVLYAGLTSLIESGKKIIDPVKADYSTVSLVIIASAVVVKILLGLYVKKKGQQVNSGALIASGSDAMFDAILSASVLASAIVYIIWGISLEAYVGVLISLVIVKAGIDMIRDTVSELLGRRVDSEFTQEIKKEICDIPEVHGAYDLILHDYGPDRYIGSVHVEIDDTLTAYEIDTLERRVAARVYDKFGILMAGVGIYARNTHNEEVRTMEEQIAAMAVHHDGVLQIHGFHIDPNTKLIMFDMILDFALKDREGIMRQVKDEIKEAFPDYNVSITMDLDI